MNKLAKSKYPTIQLFNPYSEEHLMMLQMYENKNGKSSKANEYIEKIRTTYNELDYHSRKKTSNEIEEIVFIEEQSEMIENCYIHGYKDIKTCNIFPSPSINNKQRKKILSIIKYIKQHLQTYNIFISVDDIDKILIRDLQIQGMEDLGKTEDLKKHIFLIEEKNEFINKRMIA